ncbi:non-heme iron oxygenase ferredoxin subunit [Myxococcota bacterium]|nr:non-heme iron oxygenase ferredoxin subunit [Myxococcota bacterium]
MTPFHIRRRVRGAMTSMPGPIGAAMTAILGRPEGSAADRGGPDPFTTPASTPRPVPTPVPDPRHAPDLSDDGGGNGKAPAYTPEEEEQLKKSRATPRAAGQRDVIYWQVAKRSDLPPGTGKVVKAIEREYALFNVDGEFFAIENECPHAQAPLGQGELEGHVVTCGGHGWQFDVRTGECVSRPGNRVATVPIRFDGERILLPT